MRIMQYFWDFVVFFAMRSLGDDVADTQQSKGYPSFIVRLSFVISSFILRYSYKPLRARISVKHIDY